jgi:hypothetical protein
MEVFLNDPLSKQIWFYRFLMNRTLLKRLSSEATGSRIIIKIVIFAAIIDRIEAKELFSSLGFEPVDVTMSVFDFVVNRGVPNPLLCIQILCRMEIELFDCSPLSAVVALGFDFNFSYVSNDCVGIFMETNSESLFIIFATSVWQHNRPNSIRKNLFRLSLTHGTRLPR